MAKLGILVARFLFCLDGACLLIVFINFWVTIFESDEDDDDDEEEEQMVSSS